MAMGAMRITRRGGARLGSLGVVAGVVSFVALVWWTRGELGMTWDEPYFFERQHEIRAWFGDLLAGSLIRDRALSHEGMERAWRVARAVPDQHPPIPELLSLITSGLFGWLVGPLRSYRLATVIVFAVAAAALVRLVGPRWGRWASAAALGALLFNPRLFADAQQITADVDTGTCWFLAAVVYLRFCETGRRPWLFGVFVGLAIMCKATGVLVFPAVLLWAVIHRPAGWWRPFAWSIPIIPLVMVATMPPWWSHPVGGIRRWVAAFIAYPQKVPVYYLGELYDSTQMFLPWHNTIVLTATMVPLGLLALALVGVVAGVWPTARVRGETDDPTVSNHDRPPEFLPDRVVISWASINFATWMVLRMFPGLPAHDGLRQLTPSFFFLPVLAGYGAACLVRRGNVWRRIAGQAVVVGCVGGAAWATLSYHPYELAYYNALIGGPKGAKAAGMESTYFWDTATVELLDWMNQHLPARSTVLISPPPNVRTFAWEQRFGRLRADLKFLNLDAPHTTERMALMEQAAPCFVLFQMRQGLYLRRGKNRDGLIARLASSPAHYELVPPQVGIRLVAIFDQKDFRRELMALPIQPR